MDFLEGGWGANLRLAGGRGCLRPSGAFDALQTQTADLETAVGANDRGKAIDPGIVSGKRKQMVFSVEPSKGAL